MCDVGFDDDYQGAWSEREVTARKAHRCDSCDAAILAGERYLRHFSAYDGSVVSEKLCAACDKDRDLFGDAHDGYPIPSYFQEMLQECIAEEPESAAKWGPMLAALKARGAVPSPGSGDAAKGGVDGT